MLQAYSNGNITNPEPVGYHNLIALEEALQRASDLAEEEKQRKLEMLEDDELITTASETFGELFSTNYSGAADKILNEIVKAIVLDCSKDMSIRQLLSYLPLEAEKIITGYILKHAN